MKTLMCALVCLICSNLWAQDTAAINEISIRNIGPAGMSGRFTSITVDSRNQIYAGSASGGIWKSIDGGLDWQAIFDKEAVQSIGALAISPSNDDVIWAGTGEGNPRNSHNSGAGIYKSLNGGKDWIYKGLVETKNIHRIIIDPRDENTITVGVLGVALGPSEQRGIYQTRDGGESWKKILNVGPETGCAELIIDPNNPNKMLASMWEFGRKPYFFTSGGSGSRIYMTIDGGKTWNKIDKGLPSGKLGRVGLAISASNPNIVYALVESSDIALYKSVNGGYSFEKISTDDNIGNRPFYYAEIYVNPSNENHIISLWSQVTQSIDGGKNWEVLAGWNHIHPDHHALWINPKNPKNMINGNDGGINITYDGGRHWRMCQNLPVGQFYHVAVDNEIPYNVYGGLQDNGSWRGPGFTFNNNGIRNSEWQELLFGDGFDVQPINGFEGYAMSQGGHVYYYNLKDNYKLFVQPVKEKEELRFNWNAAIALNGNEKDVIFGSQFVHYSRDNGKSWDIISEDLSTNDTSKLKQAQSGGLTIDATNAENYCTIVSLATAAKSIWAGTDDGNIWYANGYGKQYWNKRNIKELPKNAYIQQIVVDKNAPERAWIVANNYRQNDWNSYLYITENGGKTWKSLITTDIKGYCLSFMADEVNKNLYFLGTDRGLYASYNAGKTWLRLKQMPTCPVQDLAYQKGEDDLVIGTFGRAIWIMDDLEGFRKLGEQPKDSLSIIAFQHGHAKAYNMPPGARFEADDAFSGTNKDTRYVFDYYYKGNVKDKLKVTIRSGNEAIRQYTVSPSRAGWNQVTWDLRKDGFSFPTYAKYDDKADKPAGVVVNSLGEYTLVLTKGKLKDSIVFKYNDTRLRSLAEVNSTDIVRYDSLKIIVNKAFNIFEDLKEAKLRLHNIKRAEYATDSNEAKVVKICNKLIGEIDTLQLLFMLPPTFKAYEEITPRLNKTLYDAYSHILNSGQVNMDVPSNAARALKAARDHSAQVTEKINLFFANKWNDIPFETWEQWKKPKKELGNY